MIQFFQSSRLFVLTSFLLTVCANLATAVAGQCPPYLNQQIQSCVLPVAEYAKVLNQQDNSSAASASHDFGQALQLPKLGGDVFKELCRQELLHGIRILTETRFRLIRTFELCVQPYRDKCPKHITINLIEASYGYLCNEGYDTFMTSAGCLMDLDHKPSVKRCHDGTLKDIEKANKEPGITMSRKLERMCDALNFFSACVRHPIRHICGLEAWQVIFRVLKDTTTTLMPGCHFSGKSAKAEAVTYAPVVTTVRAVQQETRRVSQAQTASNVPWDVSVHIHSAEETEAAESAEAPSSHPFSSFFASSSSPSRQLSPLTFFVFACTLSATFLCNTFRF